MFVSGETVVVGATGEAPSGFFSAGSAYTFKRDTGSPGGWGQVVKLTATAPDHHDQFAASVSISAETLIIGARLDDNEGGDDAGSAYVFQTPCASCGDGILESPEQCDDGALNSDLFTNACRTDCALPSCGDGVADAGEPCDAGKDNSDVAPDACRTDCLLASCGDGVTDMGEACDNGTENSDLTPDACRLGCELPRCGDTVTDAGEQCDEPDSIAADGCDPDCTFHPANGCPWEEVVSPAASDGATGDDFGHAVSIDGDTAVIGANRHHGTGGAGAGSVYVLERHAGGSAGWGEVAELSAADAAPGDRFGFSVAIGDDTVVVGAVNDGHAGGAFSGSAYVFKRDAGGSNGWGQVTKLTASDAAAGDQFGFSVSISGDTVIVGAPNETHSGIIASGSLYVYRRDHGSAGAWGQVAKLTAADAVAGARLGWSVSIAEDTMTAGAPFDNDGSAYVFQRDAGEDLWGLVTKLTASDGAAQAQFGFSVGVRGDTAIVGAIARTHAGWADAGSAYVFERHAGGTAAWGEVALLTPLQAAAGDAFGSAVSLDDNTAVIGSRYADQPGGSDAGIAHVFERSAGGAPSWGQVARLAAFAATGGEPFGGSVSISGSTLIVGRPKHDPASAENAGGAIVFELPLTCSFCGDGAIEAGEQCDDGNNNDGDGCGATCEACANEGGFEAEVTALAFTTSAELIWQEPGGAASYAVYRGTLGKPGTLDLGAWTFDHACLDSQLSAPVINDGETPATGFYYLVTGMDACGEGPLGATTAGAPRRNDVT